MNYCINVSHPDVIKLAKEMNMHVAAIAAKIGAYQTKFDTTEIPTASDLLNSPNELNDIVKQAKEDAALEPDNPYNVATVDKYSDNKVLYTPIMDKLANTYGLPWVEDNNLTEAAGYRDGTIYVNFNKITADAPFHEYAHPITLIIKNKFPASYNRLLLEAKRHTDVIAEIERNYKDKPQFVIDNEIIVHTLGLYAKDAAIIKEKKGLLGAIKQFFTKISNLLNSILTKKQVTVDELSKLSLRELGFFMGTAQGKVDLNIYNSMFNELAKKGKIQDDGSVIINTPDKAIVDGYRQQLGHFNVAVLSSTEDNYKIKLYNPIGTEGEILNKIAAKDEKPKTAKYPEQEEPFINHVIKVLDSRIASLKNTILTGLSETERHSTNTVIKRYQGKIDELITATTVLAAIDVIVPEISKLEANIPETQKLAEIDDSLRLIQGFSVLDKYFTDQNTSKDVLDQIDGIKRKLDKLYLKYVNKKLATLKKIVLKENISNRLADNLNKPIKDINSIALNTIGSQFGSNATELAADHVIQKAAYETDIDIRKMNAESDKMAEKFNGDLSFLFDNKGNIITKYSREHLEKQQGLRKEIAETTGKLIELRKEVNQLIKDINIANINGNLTKVYELGQQQNAKEQEIIKTKLSQKTLNDYHQYMGKFFNYELKENHTTKYEQWLEQLEEQHTYIDSVTGTETFDQKAYNKEKDQYDPGRFQQYLAGSLKYPNNGHIWFNYVDKPNATLGIRSKEYKSLSKEQKEFYNYFVSKFMEANGHIESSMNEDLDYDTALLGFVNMNEDVAKKMGYLNSLKDWMTNLVAADITPSETSITGVFTGLAQKKIVMKNVSSFIDPSKPLAKQNVLKILQQHYASGKSFQYKKQVEDTLISLSELTFHLDREDLKGGAEPKTDIFGKPKTVPGESNVFKRTKHIVDSFLYNDTKDNMLGNFNIKTTDKDGNPIEKTLSRDKFIDVLSEFTRLRQLGLNPFSGISNLTMGTINNWTYAKRDEFFNEKSLRKAYNVLKYSFLKNITLGKSQLGDSVKVRAIAEHFGVVDKLLEKHHGSNKFEKMMYVFSETGEYMNQMATTVAILMDKKVVPIIYDKAGNATDKSLYDVITVKDGIMGLDDKNYDLEKSNINAKRLFEIRQGIGKINKEIHGDYDPLNKMYAKRTSLGRAIATFRTWLPQAVLQRVGKERFDEHLTQMMGKDMYRKGRYLSLGAINTKESFFSILGTLVTGLIPFVDGKLKNNGHFSEVDAANINQTLTEARILIVVIASIITMGKLSADDDELKDEWLFNFIYNMTTRAENELSFFYYPSNATQFFKDIMPSIDTIDQLGKALHKTANAVIDPESDIYQKGYRQGTSKALKEDMNLVPITKQIQNVWSTFSAMYSTNNTK